MRKKKEDSKKAGADKKPRFPRKLQMPTYKSFRLSKRLKQPKPPLKSSFRIFVQSLRVLKQNWKLFGAITLLFLVLNIILVRGFSVLLGTNETKTALIEFFKGGSSPEIAAGITIFSLLLGNAAATSGAAASVYQAILLVLFSLAIIWALRRITSQETGPIKIRDPFYKGMYPLIPFLGILFTLGVQLIPMYFASFLYAVIFGSGIAVTPLEQITWAIVLIILGLISLYFIPATIPALYISSLPSVTPWQALTSARDLVRYRRFQVFIRIMFLPIALLVIGALIIVPLIVLSATTAELVFLIASMASLPVVHSYFYHLYKELL